jgi:hypothetical protein
MEILLGIEDDSEDKADEGILTIIGSDIIILDEP